MAKHKESDFIIPVLRVIYSYGGECTTSIIKDEVGNYITLTPEDLEPMPSRSKTEPCYRQIVGNLISHKTKELFQFIDVVPLYDDKGNETRKYKLKLNEKGIKMVEQFVPKQHTITLDYPNVEEMFNVVREPEFEYNASKNVDELDNRVLEAANNDNFKRSAIANSVLGQAINRINNYTCQYAKFVGEDHKSFINKNGNMYTEAHHLIPMSASKDFFPRNLDRPSNIVTLCPNCHSTLHHGSEEEKRRILLVLYKKYIYGLNQDEIFITYEDLYEKYYK